MNPRRQNLIALAGNPNCGKSTLFNAITGARQHVGNYPGITVEKKEGVCQLNGQRMQLVDLPGTYSLTAYSMEELVARNYLIQERPSAVMNIVDASNLERNLYLTIQLLELGIPGARGLEHGRYGHRQGCYDRLRRTRTQIAVPGRRDGCAHGQG